MLTKISWHSFLSRKCYQAGQSLNTGTKVEILLFFLNNLMSYHTTQTVAFVCIQVHECLIIYLGMFKREWQADDDSGWQLKASRQNRFIFNSTFPFIKFCSVVAEQAFFACCLSDWITLCIYSFHERDVPFAMPCRHKKSQTKSTGHSSLLLLIFSYYVSKCNT